MLISAVPMVSGTIASIKLPGGEEVIAKVVEKNQTHLKVTRPVVLVPGDRGLGLMPYMFSIDSTSTVEFNLNQVVALSTCNKMIADQYIGATSGIMPAQSLPNLPDK